MTLTYAVDRWTLVLERPGREPQRYTDKLLAPLVEIAVDRLSVWRGWDDYRELTCYVDTTIFTETYTLRGVDPENACAYYTFTSLRRMHELYRKGDPARLPA